MAPWDVVLRLVAAVLCGAAIGFNREREDKPAGLRTHMLVALGAAGFTVATLDLIHRYPQKQANLDPARIVQGIAAGIGFLGAGSIFRAEERIRGMTTAAGIWVVGAIGVACGGGSFTIALVTTALTFSILAAMVALERRIPPRR